MTAGHPRRGGCRLSRARCPRRLGFPARRQGSDGRSNLRTGGLRRDPQTGSTSPSDDPGIWPARPHKGVRRIIGPARRAFASPTSGVLGTCAAGRRRLTPLEEGRLRRCPQSRVGRRALSTPLPRDDGVGPVVGGGAWQSTPQPSPMGHARGCGDCARPRDLPLQCPRAAKNPMRRRAGPLDLTNRTNVLFSLRDHRGDMGRLQWRDGPQPSELRR